MTSSTVAQEKTNGGSIQTLIDNTIVSFENCRPDYAEFSIHLEPFMNEISKQFTHRLTQDFRGDLIQLKESAETLLASIKRDPEGAITKGIAIGFYDSLRSVKYKIEHPDEA
jgi:hypothetical protein